MTNFYEQYYLNQLGHGSSLPVYSGLPVQRGHGFGNILGALARSAAPLLKRGALAVGKQLLKTGGRVLSDVSKGNKLKSSLKRRAKESVGELTQSVLGNKQKAPRKRKFRKQKRADIFD